MKKIATLLLALIMVLAIASCGHKNEQQPIHKIGVIVYDLKDEQVQAFRQYMEGYLGKNFSDVDFLYSAGITTEEEEMEFLKDAIEEGVEGIIAFNSFDLEKEVELCASGGVYYLRPSSTTDPTRLLTIHISWDISDRGTRWSIRQDMIWPLILRKRKFLTATLS